MKKVLVANRGEIALRVMRSLKEMGIQTVAVYSDIDRNAVHVKFADEAVHLGSSPSSQSYLLGDKIIAEAKRLGVDGIHPGFGFLSENAEFAASVKKAGILFIGPEPEAIRTMGNKLAAKQAVAKYNVPLVPGTDEPISDLKLAMSLCDQIGYPILIKAAAGGGGKGMRIVDRKEDFEEQMKLAQNEAKSAFGDDSVFIEKYVGNPRHIEVQVLGDNHGNIVHLFERECSIQRRHQKVIEEAPSAVLSEKVREQMGKTAVDVARSVNYTGAGTVEFIFDENSNFYFLEMNTRLQVEHTVTELITGIDLVKEQVRIARGEELSFRQEDLKITGHAIQLRVYAEDPQNNFLPDIGKLVIYRKPEGPGIRVDDGFEEGMDIPIYYDPMISKLVVTASNREDAIQRMLRAIDEYEVVGLKTTLPFGRFVMNHPDFRSGNFDTHFVKKHFKSEYLDTQTESEENALIADLALNLWNGIYRESSSVAQATAHQSMSKWTERKQLR